jgi:integrase
MAGLVRQGKDPSLKRKALLEAPTVADVLDCYLTHLQGRAHPDEDQTKERDSTRNTRWLTNRLRKKCGHLTVQDFDHQVFRTFVETTYTSRNAGSAERLINVIVTAWNHGANPLHGMRYPEGLSNPGVGLVAAIPWIAHRSKSSRAVNWSDDQWSDIMRAIRLAYGPDSTLSPIAVLVLELAMLTGARPSEIARLKWEDVEDHKFVIQGATLKLKKLIINRHKNWQNTGRPRQILIFREGSEVLRRAKEWALENDREDNAYVFPSPGRQQTKDPWASCTAYYAAEVRRIGELPALTAYNFRSAYINHARDLGVHDEIIAENCGHDLATLLKFYARHREEQHVQAAVKVDAGFAQRRLGNQKVIEGTAVQAPLLLEG